MAGSHIKDNSLAQSAAAAMQRDGISEGVAMKLATWLQAATAKVRGQYCHCGVVMIETVTL
jgi:hypothetical protein